MLWTHRCPIGLVIFDAAQRLYTDVDGKWNHPSIYSPLQEKQHSKWNIRNQRGLKGRLQLRLNPSTVILTPWMALITNKLCWYYHCSLKKKKWIESWSIFQPKKEGGKIKESASIIDWFMCRRVEPLSNRMVTVSISARAHAKNYSRLVIMHSRVNDECAREYKRERNRDENRIWIWKWCRTCPTITRLSVICPEALVVPWVKYS